MAGNVKDAINVHRWIPRTAVEGPGWRACIWVQGCTIRCPGCFNAHIWPTEGGIEFDPDDLANAILAVDGIEGLTLLGGEPFEQAPPLARLCGRVRAEGLSVMTFTGFSIEDLLDQGPPGSSDLLEQTDLLVDGPFLAAEPDTRRPWVGSTNQRFHFLSDRYRSLASTFGDDRDRLEVRLEPTGEVWINGMASTQDLRRLRRLVQGTEKTAHASG